MKNQLKSTLILKVTTEQKEYLENVARAEYLSISQLVRRKLFLKSN